MRFMLPMIPKRYGHAVPGSLPEADAIAAMMKFDETLQQAGVLLALDGFTGKYTNAARPSGLWRHLISTC